MNSRENIVNIEKIIKRITAERREEMERKRKELLAGSKKQTEDVEKFLKIRDKYMK